MKKCFGIISWLPDSLDQRKARQTRLNKLFKRIEELWPDIDILVITQNWQTYRPTKISNKIIRRNHKDGLGILKARKELRAEFLKLDYDYIIMLDDDAIIETDTETAAADFIAEIDKHHDGFCFIHTKDWKKTEKTAINTYMPAQLNLCAISKYIYEKEDIPNIDPQQEQGHEDYIYSTLLHYKYAHNEFMPPETIRCIQFRMKHDDVKSTWYGKQSHTYGNSGKHDVYLANYIKEHHELPDLDRYYKAAKYKQDVAKRDKKQAYGRKGYFLAF